ncbi:hypothetical protein [Serinicoccus sediminis]|uniref:hypothetical protein n=1 Tax=Serinicoccus sediminis TaxID=2306021 RepID=UPI00101FE477|nr:hypothetical protein [Serinicoccus sediminis]
MSRTASKPYDPAEDHDPLIELDAVAQTARNDENANKRSPRPRAVAWTSCPDCANPNIGLVQSNGHLLYKEHEKATFSGARMQCRASWSAICTNPPGGGLVNGHGDRTYVRCSHDQAATG